MRRVVVAVLALFVGAVGVSPAVDAEVDRPSLRERLRERVEARRERREAVAESRAQASGVGAALAPGMHEFRLEHDALERRYLVHVPRGYDDAVPAAVVIALHGGGGHAEYMANEQRYGLTGMAERENFVAVFPGGYSRHPGGRLATWNAGTCCGDARDRNVDDVGFIRALVGRLKDQVNVDERRIFAAGMSNGGMLGYRLACEMSDVFSAIASVAGTDGTGGCRPARPISVLHIHARNDSHVLFDGGAGPEAFRDPAKVTEFTSVPATIARWVAHNQCDATPAVSRLSAEASCETYSGCAQDVKVRLCVTESGGHSWPGAATTRRGKEQPSQALSANDVMWEFFSASAR